jgi:hypothetical protein
MNSNNININIIFDLLYIILMFGNDIIPPNYELGTELNLKILFETHYSLYNNFIININSPIIINFINLAKWLRAIKAYNSFSIIILNRFYKLPYNFITSITKKYNINDTIDKVLIPFHIYQYTSESSDFSDSMDFRKNLTSSNIYTPISDIDLSQYIDILNPNDYGLIRSSRNFELDSNPYQSLYNYTILTGSNETEDEFNRPYKIFFNNLREAETKYVELTKDFDTEEYLKLLVYISQIFFYNFDLYNPYSLFSYGDMIAPSIDMMIDFIESNDMNQIQAECYKSFSNKNPYFNYISHHLFITPYLLEGNYLDCIKDIDYIESLLNVINTNIHGIWYKENVPFSLKKIDPIIFITLCNNMIKLYQDKIINIIFKNSSNLLCE